MKNLETISGAIAKSFADQGIINGDETDIYQFGLRQLFFFVVNMITAITIGIVVGMLQECLVFSLAYMLLRRYTGGYHAKTSIRCYFLSILMVVVVLFSIKAAILYEWNDFCIIATMFSGVVIYLKAPIESENKPLDDAEYRKYRKCSLIIMIIEEVIVLTLFFFSNSVSVCIAFAVISAATMLLISTLLSYMQR